MKRIILDTNIYIDWLNEGSFENLLLGRQWVRRLSAVVVMELRAGATTRAAEKSVDQLVRAYKKGGRLLVPSASTYEQAGDVLRRLRRRGHSIRRAAFISDVLIALSARSIGATLFTRDRKDFMAIASVVDLEWEVAS